MQSGSTLMEDTGGLVGFDGFELGQDVYKDYERVGSLYLPISVLNIL